MLIRPHNKNESPEHYELKQIGKYVLWSCGYKHVATEVGGFYGGDLDFPRSCFHKNIIDVAGVKTSGWNGGHIPKMRLMGIEAKASLSDFRNGYCTACEYTYIIAPIGIIPVSKIPQYIGLIEVDLQNYKISRTGGELIDGITRTIKAKSRLATRFEGKEQRQNWTVDQFRRIAYRASVENVFNNARINLEG